MTYNRMPKYVEKEIKREPANCKMLKSKQTQRGKKMEKHKKTIIPSTTIVHNNNRNIYATEAKCFCW